MEVEIDQLLINLIVTAKFLDIGDVWGAKLGAKRMTFCISYFVATIVCVARKNLAILGNTRIAMYLFLLIKIIFLIIAY